MRMRQRQGKQAEGGMDEKNMTFKCRRVTTKDFNSVESYKYSAK